MCIRDRIRTVGIVVRVVERVWIRERVTGPQTKPDAHAGAKRVVRAEDVHGSDKSVPVVVAAVPVVVAAVPVVVATVPVVVATVSEVAAAYDVAVSERSSIHAARSVDSGRRTRTHPSESSAVTHRRRRAATSRPHPTCLLYTSDAADERSSVD